MICMILIAGWSRSPPVRDVCAVHASHSKCSWLHILEVSQAEEGDETVVKSEGKSISPRASSPESKKPTSSWEYLA